jgi:hypothetical protein
MSWLAMIAFPSIIINKTLRANEKGAQESAKYRTIPTLPYPYYYE